MKNFREKTLQGIAWNVVRQIGEQVIKLVIGIVLARILSPHEFGLIGMLTVITGFAKLFTDFGLASALIQKQDVTQKHLSSVFWINTGSGLLLTLGLVVTAPWIAEFYGEPILAPLALIVSAEFFLGSLVITQRVLMKKALNFRAPTLIGIFSMIVSGGFGIILALQGFGVWSLAIQSVSGTVLTVALFWYVADWKPAFQFEWKALKELMGFSLNLFASKTLNYWVRNVDNLLIGKYLGSQQLGVYSRAYTLMLFPLQNVSQVLTGVMFPSFSLIQHDKERVRRIFLMMTRAIALLTFPLMTWLLVTAKPFVLTLLGPKWIEVVPILEIMCVVGATQSIGTLNGNLYLSQGKAALQLRVGLVMKSIRILAIVVGLQWGIYGVAVAYAVSAVVLTYPSFYFAGKLVNLTNLELVKSLSGITFCSTAMAILVYLTGFLFDEGIASWAALGIQAVVGVSLYWLFLSVFKVQAFHDFKSILSEQFGLAFSGKNR